MEIKGLNANNTYDAAWNQVVSEYLNNGYKEEGREAEITVTDTRYKVLDRGAVTVFYDADGNTLFEVDNTWLEAEYERLVDSGTKALSEHEALEEDNENVDAEEHTVMDQEKADSEIGETPAEERAEEEKEKEPGNKADDVKGYASGEEKLIAEENEMLSSVKPEFKEVMQAQFDLVFKELISWTKQDPEFDKLVLLDHKSMKRCMKFCAEKAMGLREPSDQEKAAARNNNIPIMTPVGSDMLFEWIKEYYSKDDKAEAEKEKKVAADQKKTSDKEIVADKHKSVQKEPVSKKQEKKPTEKKGDTKATGSPKKQDKFVNGQISMFDLLGV